ncbi:MAG: SDR family oxidoreductase [Firmicutes bacterium]|nr:SDR family oxidoreductase [Bacillota bacterium]
MEREPLPVALVTGGNHGIARVICTHLAQVGYPVAVNYRSGEAAARALVRELQEQGVPAEAFAADVSQPDAVQRMALQVQASLGAPLVLVHAAGPFIDERKRVDTYSEDQWRAMIDGNLSSAFYLARAVVPGMRAAHFGRIITFGFPRSQDASGWPLRGAYAAAKTGLVSLTRTMALELAQDGITANMVVPGNVRPDFKEKEIAEARGIHDPQTPIGRPATGGDLARAVLFLATREADAITGAVLEVTGGVDVVRSQR